MKNKLISLHNYLIENNITIAFAESCTGGMLSSEFTKLSGSSKYFLGSVISYSNKLKEDILLVSKNDLKKYGAVSKIVAEQMCLGLSKIINANCIISITGIAGPTGGTKEKPVGTVYFGIMINKKLEVFRENFSGKRNKIRKNSVEYCINTLYHKLLE